MRHLSAGYGQELGDRDAGGASLLPVNLDPVDRTPAAFEKFMAATTGSSVLLWGVIPALEVLLLPKA